MAEVWNPDDLITAAEGVALLGLTWQTWERLRRLPSFPRPWHGATRLWRKGDLMGFVSHGATQLGRLCR